MKIVIFAGGTGKRFWPVSRVNSPKQFLAVTGDEPLLRKAVNRAKRAVPVTDIFISTGKKYGAEVQALLPEIPAQNFLLEPVMRDSGPAVTLAAAYINKHFPGEAMAALWSDHLVKDEDLFGYALLQAEVKVKSENKVVFISTAPRFPSPHRGYIQFQGDPMPTERTGATFYAFDRFVEKPSVEVAMDYMESGVYGWNLGYWVMQPSKYLEVTGRERPQYVDVCTQMVEAGLDIDQTEAFSQLEKISADYAFAEHVKSPEGLVLMADIGWSDVGEWIAMKEALETAKHENVILGNVADLDCTDSLIYNYEDGKLVAAIGLNGMVVVNTKDVVAVFPQSDNVKLKTLISLLEEKGLTQYL
jgi:mannose-1-phosphate guanylyltransferase